MKNQTKRHYCSYISALLLIGAILLNGVFASTDGNETKFSDIKKETSELLSSLKDYSIDKKDAALNETKQALRKLDQRIDTLQMNMENQWDDINSATKDQYVQSLKELRMQRAEVSKWYEDMLRSTDVSWEYVKSGFSDAYQVMADTWEDVENEYSDTDSQ